MAETQRTPDQFVKRAPTTTTAVAVGTSTSTIALVAYYINQCLTAEAWVVPSTEMIIVLLGYVVPIFALGGKIAQARLRAFARASGVEE